MKCFSQQIASCSDADSGSGAGAVAFAQTKPTAKRRTTTRRAAPLVPVGTDLKFE